MQKLEKRDTYTPLDASQVQGNCDSVIKHGQDTIQVLQDLKTFSNNSDVNRSQHRGSSDLRVQNIVYVLNMRGEPLMPTYQQKANKLLKQEKAKVVSRKPFTIQLKYATGETKQPITLGVDAGYKYVGISAKTDKKELFSAEVTLRTDIPKKLQTRAMYRKNRRSRLWYRQLRFLNRRISKGWLAPSIQHKLDSHLRIVEKIKQFLSVTKIIIEVASFDIQKIKTPDIKGKEYQQGEQLGFWNLREYVLHRDNHICQHCHGKKHDPILQVHHINGKKEGATDRPEELLTVCKTCHDEHHSGKDIIPKKKVKSFKPETFMTTVRWKIINALGCKHTYGYITKHNRIKQGIAKSHVNDAFIIAGGTNQDRCTPYITKQIRRNNRKLQINRKGFKPSVRKQHYSLQSNDLVKYGRGVCRVKAVFNYGKWITLIDNIGNIINSNIKNIELICYGKGVVFG